MGFLLLAVAKVFLTYGKTQLLREHRKSWILIFPNSPGNGSGLNTDCPTFPPKGEKINGKKIYPTKLMLSV